MKKELIGIFAEIEYAGKKFKGTIINETKNSFEIQTKEGTKTVIKINSTLQINNKTIKGHKINKRPEDRVKI